MIDHFFATPEMSTFTFGFVISQLTEIKAPVSDEKQSVGPRLRIWARPEFHSELHVSKIILTNNITNM